MQVPASTKATNPLDKLTVQILVVELENDFAPELFPAEAVADIVGGVAVIAYGPESPLKESVRDAAVTVKLRDVAVAEAYPPAAAIEEPMVQVPASTKATRPLEELTVQIPVVELKNDFVPELFPADAVADIVGGVAVNTYGPESPLRVSVRDTAVTVKLRDDAVAAAYPLAAVIDEPMVHVPASTKATRPLDELTVQMLVVELENDFVPELSAAEAVADIVGGVAVNTYGPESPLRVSVRDAAVTERLTSVAVAAANPPPEVIDAPIVQVPASTKATKPLDELTVHTLVVELEKVFVPDPTPADGVAVIVGGVAVNT